MATPRPITFLSDYGYEDEFAGVCRAVISQIAPGAPLIDLTHGIARQDVRQGAIALANALPSCPPGVHLAVVDPGVGSDRRAVAVEASEGRFLVGPDNGLLSRALDRLGGPLHEGEWLALRAPDGRFEALWARTFADVSPGEVLLFEDSSGAMALAVSGGSAAGLLDLEPDREVTLRPL